MIGGLGIPELLVILVIVLIIFGAGKLPQIGGNLGKAIKNFKSGIAEEKVGDQPQAATQEKIEGKPVQDKANS
jgi:sec-independent protein translocase protein TatA